jgi:hypothetical protein
MVGCDGCVRAVPLCLRRGIVHQESADQPSEGSGYRDQPKGPSGKLGCRIGNAKRRRDVACDPRHEDALAPRQHPDEYLRPDPTENPDHQGVDEQPIRSPALPPPRARPPKCANGADGSWVTALPDLIRASSRHYPPRRSRGMSSTQNSRITWLSIHQQKIHRGGSRVKRPVRNCLGMRRWTRSVPSATTGEGTVTAERVFTL